MNCARDCYGGFHDGSVVKHPPEEQETYEIQVGFLGWEDPLQEEMATYSVFLPGESHGQSSLAATVCEVAELTELLNTHTHFSL